MDEHACDKGFASLGRRWIVPARGSQVNASSFGGSPDQVLAIVQDESAQLEFDGEVILVQFAKRE